MRLDAKAAPDFHEIGVLVWLRRACGQRQPEAAHLLGQQFLRDLRVLDQRDEGAPEEAMLVLGFGGQRAHHVVEVDAAGRQFAFRPAVDARGLEGTLPQIGILADRVEEEIHGGLHALADPLARRRGERDLHVLAADPSTLVEEPLESGMDV